MMIVSTACSSKGDKATQDPKQQTSFMQPIEVGIQVPSQLEPKKEYVLQVHLQQGKAAIDDASDVQFEIWKKDQLNKGKKIKAQHEQNGVYTVKNSFPGDGVYYIQTHVTAHGMHVMPVKMVVVGHVSEQELKSETDQPSHQMNGSGHHH